VHLGSKENTPVAVVSRGESVGELRLIDNAPPSAFVVAREPCRVLAVGPEAFWGLINASHEFTVNLLGLLSRRLRGNNDTVNESRRLQDEYKRHAAVDGLTGLFNRRRLDEVLPRYTARAHFENNPLTLVMVDVDHFKSFNDTFGHVAGDRVLYEVARILRERCRPSDFVARFGGEEFTVVLPGALLDDALVVADRLRNFIATHTIRLESGVELPAVTASFGLAQLLPGETAGAALTRADEALYEAKRSGRNRACANRRPI
jgi:diguanylate cyclase (GGDEF)-like protein